MYAMLQIQMTHKHTNNPRNSPIDSLSEGAILLIRAALITLGILPTLHWVSLNCLLLSDFHQQPENVGEPEVPSLPLSTGDLSHVHSFINILIIFLGLCQVLVIARGIFIEACRIFCCSTWASL